MQLAHYTELRNVFTQQFGIHMDHRDVLHQAGVHILYLITHRQILHRDTKDFLYVWFSKSSYQHLKHMGDKSWLLHCVLTDAT